MQARYVRAALALLTTAAVAGGLVLTGGGGYAASGLALSKSATAQQYQYPSGCPGAGVGDDNHVHTGPPGQSEYGPPGQQYPPAPQGCTGPQPGWGCGDDNHVHTGPPGQRQYGPRGNEYPPTPPPGCAEYKGR